ncbi:hypothetical protein SDJN03_01030, partial [Cucurbita argyrosperma subsp. sororia]
MEGNTAALTAPSRCEYACARTPTRPYLEHDVTQSTGAPTFLRRQSRSGQFTAKSIAELSINSRVRWCSGEISRDACRCSKVGECHIGWFYMANLKRLIFNIELLGSNVTVAPRTVHS